MYTQGGPGAGCHLPPLSTKYKILKQKSQQQIFQFIMYNNFKILIDQNINLI